MNHWEVKKNNLLDMNLNEVHIWKIQIPYHMFDEINIKKESNKDKLNIINSSIISKFKKIIDENELKSAIKFYKISDQICAITTRYVLKKIISSYLKLNPNKIQFFYNEFGKPFLCHEVNPISLQFNLSHAGDFIVFAFTRNAQIGVDIERFDSSLDKQSLASHIFSDQEFSKWKILSESEKLDSFYHIWSCKEAILKGFGIGLSYMPKYISVNMNPNELPAILNLENCEYENNLNAWSLCKFYVQSNYSAIFAIRKREFHTLFCEWSWDNFV